MYRSHSVPLGLMTCKHAGVSKHVSWFMVSSSCLRCNNSEKLAAISKLFADCK